MTTSDNRSWALVGPLSVALWAVGMVLVDRHGPADHATGSQILAWYKSNTNPILLGGWLFMLGCLGFVAFVAGLRSRLAGAAVTALVGAGMAAVCGMLATSVDLAGVIDRNNITPAIAATFHHSTDIFFLGAEMAAIVPLAAIAIVAWRTRVLPRWWAAFSALVAIVLVIGPIGWLGVVFGMPIWTLGTSLFVLLRRQPRLQPSVAAA